MTYLNHFVVIQYCFLKLYSTYSQGILMPFLNKDKIRELIKSFLGTDLNLFILESRN